MKVTVFGATGGIGGQVVRQALDAGHTVTAIVRSGLALEHPRLEVVRVPGLTDPGVLAGALAGSDAAISGVGPRGRQDVTVASSTTRVILQALRAAGVQRFAAVSAAPVGPLPEGEGWLTRRVIWPLISWLLRDIYADLAVMEREIAASGLQWTIVRPPRLVNTPLTNAYRLVVGGNVPHGRIISRADVAHAMLAILDDPATVNQPVGVAR